MDGAVGVYVEAGAAAALSFQGTVYLRGAVLRDEHAGRNAAVVGNNYVLPILVDDAYGLALEQIAVLPEDIGFRPLPHDRVGGHDENIFVPLDLYMKAHL